MGKHNRPGTPTLIKRIIEEADLPKNEKDVVQRMRRDQLVDLHFYIKELKLTNEELIVKINELHQQNNGDQSDREIKGS